VNVNTYPRNQILEFKAENIDPGAPGLTIKTFDWKINTNIQDNNTNTLPVDTNTLNDGINTISLRIMNSCGSWSNIFEQQINISGDDQMQKDVEVIVNAPVIEVNVTMELTGDVNFTVTNPLGEPLAEAVIVMADKTALTDSAGKATITGVVYGTYMAGITTHWTNP